MFLNSGCIYLRLLPALLLSFYLNAPAFADDTIPILHLNVAQEISRYNGVLISRPRPLHQEIVDLVTRHKIKSLEDYAQWLEDNLRYQNDGKADNWASPQQTLRKKAGDCEDYALLNTSVMQVLGYQPHFLALVRTKGRTHAICTFKHQGRFLWFDNAKLQKTSFTSLEQLAKEISDRYNYSALFEFDFKTKHWNILYKKS